jgi:hypothetical protein
MKKWTHVSSLGARRFGQKWAELTLAESTFCRIAVAIRQNFRIVCKWYTFIYSGTTEGNCMLF